MSVLLLSVLLVGSVASESQQPLFEWMQDSSHPNPVLKITYPNGDEDFAPLQAYNPVPLSDTEREEDIDACIYHGYLAGEKNVYVTLAGCVNSNSFDIQLRSKKLNNHMFQVRSGEAQAVLSEDGIESSDDVIVVEDLERMLPVSERGLNPNGYNINVRVRYDQTFKAKFGKDALNTVRRLLAFVQNNYRHPSLTIPINLNVHPKIDAVPGKHNPKDLGQLGSKYSTDDETNTNIFLTKSKERVSLRGVAYLGIVCLKGKNNKYKVMVSEYWGTDMEAAQTISHELGHNLGMKHDFGKNGAERFDSEGNECTKIGAFMDYSNKRDKWSTCSVEDLTALVNKYTEFCLTPIE